MLLSNAPGDIYRQTGTMNVGYSLHEHDDLVAVVEWLQVIGRIGFRIHSAQLIFINPGR
jgi:hypothetical protein